MRENKIGIENLKSTIIEALESRKECLLNYIEFAELLIPGRAETIALLEFGKILSKVSDSEELCEERLTGEAWEVILRLRIVIQRDVASLLALRSGLLANEVARA